MSRRWKPPGYGWIRTADYGKLAIWMRPASEGTGVDIAMYAGDGFGATPGLAETWLVTVPPGSWMPETVMDKPRRIVWVLGYDVNSGDESSYVYGATSVWFRHVDASHKGHRRLNRKRYIHKRPLPRKIRMALGRTADRFSPRGLLTTIQRASAHVTGHDMP